MLYATHGCICSKYRRGSDAAEMCDACAGQAIAQLNCVDWIVKAIHLFILFQGNWTDEAICMAYVPLLWPAA